MKFYCKESFCKSNYKRKQMCGKFEIHLCINVSKDLKTIKLNILFQIQRKREINQWKLQKWSRTRTSLILWSKLKNTKQTCYISIWNWQCYITIGEVLKLVFSYMGEECYITICEVLKLVFAHMGGDCCTLCVILHQHIPHINRILHQVAKSHV